MRRFARGWSPAEDRRGEPFPDTRPPSTTFNPNLKEMALAKAGWLVTRTLFTMAEYACFVKITFPKRE
jgi:hypothetical protein